MASAGQRRDSVVDAQFDPSDLLNALESVNEPEVFASIDPIPRLDPEIFIKDIGRIGIPLSEAQAKQLAAKCHQAPYEEGSETIIDRSVRNTWELDPDQFEIKAPNWQKYLDKLLEKVAEVLNVSPPISAELYKMLLYEKGAMFKAHTDTEKIPGMFGTLVISLPSPHTGGQVTATHRGRSFSLQTSQYDMAGAYWFSDVSHSVSPVRSGYRWVLTYNLAIDPSAEIPTACGYKEHRGLREALQSWSQDVRNDCIGPTPLYFVFDHKYTEENISYQGLKPRDLAVVKCIREMCDEYDFDLFLTTLEREDTGPMEFDEVYEDWLHRHRLSQYRYDDDEGEYDEDGYEYTYPSTGGALADISERSYKLQYVSDLNGQRLASDVEFDEDEVLQEDPFEDDPDDEDYEGCTYDELSSFPGPQATHWYRLSALAIVPRIGTVPFLTSGSYGPIGAGCSQGLWDYFITRCTDSPESKEPLAQLRLLLEATSHCSSKSLTLDTFQRLLQVSIHGCEPGMLDFVLSRTSWSPPTEFFTWLKDEYSKSSISIDHFGKLFRYAMRLQPTVRQQYEVVSTTLGDAAITDEQRDIIYQVVDDCLKQHRGGELYDRDGSDLFKISILCGGFGYVKTAVMPIIAAHSVSTAFVLDFLVALFSNMEEQHVPSDDARFTYEHIARLAISDLRLPSLIAIDDRIGVPFLSISGDRHVELVTPSLLLRFIVSLIRLELDEHQELLAQKVLDQAKTLRLDDLNKLWVPLLKDLFDETKAMFPMPHLTRIYQELIRTYLEAIVDAPPTKPTPSRPGVGHCACQGCAELNKFLANPSKTVGHFQMVGSQRKHLERQLDSAQVDCMKQILHTRQPYTLVVTKTEDRYTAKLRAWREKRQEAKNWLNRQFGQDTLRIVLGDQFDEITSMKWLEGERRRDPLQPAATAANHIAGTKRKHAEIIDLTGED
ncbi:hypothetical protein F5Y04DRAFT_249498 [Hypomontagnella monticulosa]|nr:hypothetical protein F5Y04DRAFT_249498 [Hypomontagnella monticulosa]